MSAERPLPEQLSDGWTTRADGVRTRRAARVLVLDEAGRVLVLRGHDADEPDRHWWFSVGGGIDPGESVVEAALREVREETGIELDATVVHGPVLTRSAYFDFARERCLQHEQFFVAYVGSDAVTSTDGWTRVERSFLDEMAWMTPAQLRTTADEVFPGELPDLVEWLAAGWDGTLRRIDVDSSER